jgi:Na+/H+-dicarboxylate symporter
MKPLRAYGMSLLLIFAIVAGLLLGRLSPDTARAVRPIGELFLNLIFMVIVPLVFFTVSSSIASSGSAARLSRVSGWMLGTFLLTSLLAATSALLFMLLVQPAPGAGLVLQAQPLQQPPSWLQHVVRAFTASDFPEMLSRKAMLPLLVFSAAVGVATLQRKEKGEPFARVLQSGAQVFTRVVELVMYLAPVGLLAYFAATVADTGQQLATSYPKVLLCYYAFAGVYFVGGFSFYAFAAGRAAGLRAFWGHMLRPSLTALGTCSSMATLPVNLEAAPKMGVPRYVSDVVVPVGAIVHKDGSVIGGVVKVLFAMSLFGWELTAGRIALAVGVAVLVGVVMGAIPSGGMIGELLILSVFGFPPEALPLLAIISVVIDPAATLLNASGDNAAAMLVTRVTEGDVWNRAAAQEPLAEKAA